MSALLATTRTAIREFFISLGLVPAPPSGIERSGVPTPQELSFRR